MDTERFEQITVCALHQEENLTPLLATLAFMGSEYWCPYCGYTSGIFGAGVQVQSSSDLLKKRDILEDHWKNYLHATAMLYACGTQYEGRNIHPNDLPDEVKAQHEKDRMSWKAGMKIEA